jgi:RNA:NAD 2'-phosphotransferase (TPT1/KptA family)
MVLMMIWRPQGLLPMKRPHLKLRQGKQGEQEASQHQHAVLIEITHQLARDHQQNGGQYHRKLRAWWSLAS